MQFVDIDPPTIRMRILVNDSPFAGREGKFVTARHVRERLVRETRGNVSLQMSDTEVAALGQMQWLGECPAPWPINSEIGTLADDTLPGGKLFRFLRYDVRLEHDWLKSELGVDIDEADVIKFRTMDDPGIVKEIFEIGRVAAERYVKPEHWISS